jgi:hypothetical protein
MLGPNFFLNQTAKYAGNGIRRKNNLELPFAKMDFEHTFLTKNMYSVYGTMGW